MFWKNLSGTNPTLIRLVLACLLVEVTGLDEVIEIIPVTESPEEIIPVTKSPEEIIPVTESPEEIIPVTKSPEEIIPVTKSPEEIIPVTESPEEIIPGSQERQIIPDELISEALYKKLATYTQYAPGFAKFNSEELRNLALELETWEEPEELRKNFPYYFTGYDDFDRPVWVAEIGKYNIRRYVELGMENHLLKLAFKAIYRVIRSIYVKDTPEREIRHGVFILDYDNFNLKQVSHPETVDFMLRVVRDYKEVIDQILGACLLINVNYASHALVNFLRPFLGRVFERIEVYGNNKVKWVPILRRKLPPNVIPTWYGGTANPKSFQIHG